MINNTQRQKLRTKTGCLTCRSRRKKCDEQGPVCKRCAVSKRQCKWPTSADLLDRRYTAHDSSRHQTSPPPAKSTICRISEKAAFHVFAGSLESFISRHFVEKYYRLLLLPNCHPGFYDGWITEIQELMVVHKSLHYSVLTNAASHLHFIRTDPKMQELALTYYSQALKGLASLLHESGQLENHNGLLMSMMLLYLHECTGRGTYLDIPRHLNAACHVLHLRLFKTPLTIRRPFDRLAVESMLYQIFLVSTGLWSDGLPLDYSFDAEHWLRAEQLLNQSMIFPGYSISYQSPVLGIPVSLFRLAMSAKQLYQSPLPRSQAAIDRLRSEVETWEAMVLCDKELDILASNEAPDSKHKYYKHAGYLYILTISLLLDQVSGKSILPEPSSSPCSSSSTTTTTTTTTTTKGYPSMAPSTSWQIIKARQILSEYNDDEGWAGCFIANWPIYTLGFFMTERADLERVRGDLEWRWKAINLSQPTRFIMDLEIAWVRRGLINRTSNRAIV